MWSCDRRRGFYRGQLARGRSALNATDVVKPLRQFFRGVKGLPGAIQPLDGTTKTLTHDGGRFTHTHAVSFDRLVLALGSITDLSAGPSLANYGWPGRFSVGETLNAQFAGVRTGFHRALEPTFLARRPK